MRFDATGCGKRIQELRKSHGLTQEQLAEKLCITCKHLQKIEAGRAMGSTELLIDFAILMDVSLDYLLLGKGYPQKKVKQHLRETIQMLRALEQAL